ncbi:MAG: hypothetical protein KDA89_17555, partial [Planctomycetaceae bacterium]|nr:hypothetical protein [Planctomycetaceae bacterium]
MTASTAEPTSGGKNAVLRHVGLAALGIGTCVMGVLIGQTLQSGKSRSTEEKPSVANELPGSDPLSAPDVVAEPFGPADAESAPSADHSNPDPLAAAAPPRNAGSGTSAADAIRLKNPGPD